MTPSINITSRIVKIPSELESAFISNERARELFNSLSIAHKKEYVSWIESAKKEETRKIRALKTIEMLNAKQKNR